MSPMPALAPRVGALLLLLLAAGCGQAVDSVVVSDDVGVVAVPDEDAAMNQAIAEAKAHLATFERELAAAAPGRVFTVKKRFATPDGGGEHIWITDVKAAKGGFEGIVDNEPRSVEGVGYGDRHFVARDDVTDWMITDAEGKRWGCYTTRVLLPTMPDELRRLVEPRLQPLPK